MATIADYIAKNNEVILNLHKMNLLPYSVMQYYEIYRISQSLNHYRKMDMYQIIAERNNCSVDTVRKAIREMKKECLNVLTTKPLS
jgi:hypothetical protein